MISNRTRQSGTPLNSARFGTPLNSRRPTGSPIRDTPLSRAAIGDTPESGTPANPLTTEGR